MNQPRLQNRVVVVTPTLREASHIAQTHCNLPDSRIDWQPGCGIATGDALAALAAISP
jgi:hypothetical protein